MRLNGKLSLNRGLPVFVPQLSMPRKLRMTKPMKKLNVVTEMQQFKHPVTLPVAAG